MASPQQPECRVLRSGQGRGDLGKSNKQNRFREGEELALNSSAANQVPAAPALYPGHTWGTLWPWAGDCWSGQWNAGSCWHRLASHIPKYTGKRKREDHINHCCCGEQLPEMGLFFSMWGSNGDKRLIETDECNWVVWKRGDEMKWNRKWRGMAGGRKKLHIPLSNILGYG